MRIVRTNFLFGHRWLVLAPGKYFHRGHILKDYPYILLFLRRNPGLFGTKWFAYAFADMPWNILDSGKQGTSHDLLRYLRTRSKTSLANPAGGSHTYERRPIQKAPHIPSEH